MQKLVAILNGLLASADRLFWNYALGLSNRYYRDSSSRVAIQQFGAIMRMKLVLGTEIRSKEPWGQRWNFHVHEVTRNPVRTTMPGQIPYARLTDFVTFNRECRHQKNRRFLQLSGL
jgi:hypothetical protein